MILCPYCARSRCDCDERCPNCGKKFTGSLSVRCQCEHLDRINRDFDQSNYQMDEDVADELARQYPNEPRSKFYWHGFNYVRKVGRKAKVNCPYKDTKEVGDFWRGVSDARHSL